MAARDGVTGAMTVTGGLVTSSDPAVIAWLRSQSGKGEVGREVPADEMARYSATLSGNGFEPAPHVLFGNGGEPRSASRTKGNHGFWPTRPDYHSIYLLSGPGVTPAKLGTIAMTSLNGRFESVLGVSCPR
jgi:hypothetical protein